MVAPVASEEDATNDGDEGDGVFEAGAVLGGGRVDEDEEERCRDGCRGHCGGSGVGGWYRRGDRGDIPVQPELRV